MIGCLVACFSSNIFPTLLSLFLFLFRPGRHLNIVRANNKLMGSPVNRLNIMALAAAKGASITRAQPLSTKEQVNRLSTCVLRTVSGCVMPALGLCVPVVPLFSVICPMNPMLLPLRGVKLASTYLYLFLLRSSPLRTGYCGLRDGHLR